MSPLVVMPAAHANVFASNLRLDGGITNVSAAPGELVEISYLLNEPASGGVTVEVLSGTTVTRKVVLPPNGPGALGGTNSVWWDLRDSSSNAVPGGEYRIRITAVAQGYTNWNQVSLDSDPNTYVYFGRGISSVQSPQSPYYGRLLVANSQAGFQQDVPGEKLGILKFNADSSTPEDGIASTGGRNWSGGGQGPWKVEAANDFVYANDTVLGGLMFRWNPTISTNSLTPVLRVDNLTAGATFGGFAVVGSSSNAQLWGADRQSNLGVVKWNLAADGTCATNDTGVTVVGVGSDPLLGLTLPPQDVALDKDGNIYVCQAVADQKGPANRVFRFAAYDPSTNGGLPTLVAAWGVGAGDDTYGVASGIAVDPTGTYVAVSFEGVPGFGLPGNTKVLYATNGALVTNIDLGMVIQGVSDHQDTDCAWDAAGNLCYIDNYVGTWRIVSPPGTNQMTTLATATVLVTGQLVTPQITGISVANGTVRLTFSAGPNDLPSSFAILSTGSLEQAFSTASNATISSNGPGSFSAVIPVAGPAQFYRVKRQP